MDHDYEINIYTYIQYNTMMKEHRYSSEIKSIRLQTSLYDSVSQSATPSRMAHNSTTV